MKGGLYLLKGIVSAGLLIYLFRTIDGTQFLQILREAHPGLLITAGGLYLGAQGLSAWRWQILLRGQRVVPPVRKLFSFYLVGMFFNNFLPSSMGGDLVRGWDLYRHGGSGGGAAATVFLERYTGLAALMAIGVSALSAAYFYFPDPATAFLQGGILAAFILATLLLTNRSTVNFFKRWVRQGEPSRWQRGMSDLYDALAVYRNRRDLLSAAVLISFPIQIVNILVYILLADSLGVSIHWGYFFLFFPIVTVIAMLPISFNGLGMREGMMVYLFGKAGVAPAQALGLSLTWFFVVTAISLLGGAIFFLRREGRTGRPPDPR